MAVKCPMPQFVARCLEEIGLEGRCGMPLRALFDAMDPENDVAYRHFTWSVLRGMENQLSFHIMRPLERNTVNAADVPDRKLALNAEEDGATLRRKRKWETTLLVSTSVDSPVVKTPTEDDAERTPKRHKTKSQPLQPVLPSMRRIAAQKQRRRLSESDCESRDRSESAGRVQRHQGSMDGSGDGDVNDTVLDDGVMKEDPKKQSNGRTHNQEKEKNTEISIKREEGDSADETRWVLRSPRGYRLGEEVKIDGLSYEDAVASDQDGVLGVVACEELRLKYLGVQDSSSMDTISPQFDLLEIIGRSRIRGENAAVLTNSQLFGDSRKLHYLLDMLIACKYVVKNIVTADQRRFNIVHLRRFASKFHPSMISPSATIARQSFPKEALAQVIVNMMKARGERTCVFADIGRELGYGKRHQEQLRNYFIQQMNAKPSFPLQLFMARCKTAGEYIGRKLWCIRLRNGSLCASSPPHRRRGLSENFEEFGPDTMAAGRPVVERGIMEQMYVAIQDRDDVGATVPELRDVLGVPTFKLPYKLAQGLISNYNISVEQVVMGKSTMYRMFVPGAGKRDGSCRDAGTGNDTNSANCNTGVRVTRANDKYSTPKGSEGNSGNCGQLQPGTMMEATRGMVRASTIDRRRNYILKRVQMEKVVSLHQLRTGLIEMERVCEATTLDIRSVHRIVDELVDEKKMTTMDISLPPKQVLQKAHRKVKCAVLLGYQRSREAIREFIKAYEEEQQRKYQANFAAHDNDDYVVVTNRRQQRRTSGRVAKEAPAEKPRDQEVVNYSAVSYKLARIGLAKLQKQSRRLGMFFGMMYKCRAFHGMIWDRIAHLGAQESVGKTSDTETKLASNGLKEITFALKDVLDLLSVKEYVQLVGIPELLYEQEEAAVRLAVSKGGSWDVLPEALVEKVRGCEADRFSKIVRVLLDLRLLQVVHDTSSAGLFNVFQTSDDFDSIVSRVAFATLSGGLFKIKRHVHISVKQGSSVLYQLPPEYSYAYAPGFSCKSKSDHFSGRVPLEFVFNEVDDVKAYWKSLRFLSLEGALLGTKSTEANSVSINLDGAVIRSAPLSDHNIYILKAWVPHSTTNTRNSTARAKAAAGPIQALKRKRFASGAEESLQKRRKMIKTSKGSISALMTPVDTSEAGVSHFRKQVGAKKTCRNLRWTLEDDLRLIDLYLEQMSCRWFIEVPLALQRTEERVAFRTTNLSRTLISWKELSKVFKKRPIECLLRVNDLLEAPAIQARLERAKATITQMKNPGGDFHEEIAIMHQPRLVALLCRALQVILHERSSYYSGLADILMNSWTETEVKLIWRYLWLAGIITRTPQANEGKDQKQRGFQIHSKVFEMKSLKIPHYLMETFCEAAKYLSFVNENIAEATMLDEENGHHFEHELEVNIPSGQAGMALSSMVSGFSHLIPTFAAPGKHSADNREIQRAMAVKGLSGHLSRQWGGAFPEDFLKEYWAVKSVFGVSDVRTQAQNIKTMEAFSGSAHVHQEPQRDTRAKKRRRTQEHSLSAWLSSVLTEAAGSGLTINELVEKYTATELAAKAGLSTVPTTQIQREVDEMLYDGCVLEVNGYDHCRFVLKEFASLWTLQPYRVSSDSTAEKVHFQFDKSGIIVARPWLHLDGSVNTKMAFTLKRKVVNIVMCCPGIQDRAVHKKMRKIVSLQDMRSLLEELVASGVIYVRVFRDVQSSIASIFNEPNAPLRRETDIFTLSPGELRYADFSRERLHYFPSVNCMELFGAEVCDADLG